MSKDKVDKREDLEYINTESEKELLEKITDRYRASYIKKESLGMNTLWGKCEDYWSGDVNTPEDEDDPGSETNIVQSIIESQVADLVDGQMEVLLKGVGPSDAPFATDVSQLVKWVWQKNKMIPKFDEGERDRLNLGSVGWKVYYDFDALKGRGLPIMQPCSPDTLFPDPKINDPRKINDGDFFIQAQPYPCSWFRRRFGKRGKFVKPEGRFGLQSYHPTIFGEEDDSTANEVINDQAVLFEYWEKDDDGNLRRVYCTRDIILEDSDWDHYDEEKGERKSFYEHGKYPFVILVCYKKKGRLWGKSDTEQLIPIQDVINELDDQIRMNARLMGNIQIVVGTAAGINIKKWTNKPGLKIPAKDHTAWETVNPPTIPGYIYTRRQEGFNESEVVSGRSDVVEGRRSGSLRAASAILALQEAGSRRANHKKLMLQEGFIEVIELLLDYIKEFMDEEQAFDVTENDKTDYLWYRGSSLKEIPYLTLNENWNPEDETLNTSRYRPLKDENGEMITKEAEFDIEISLGAGMPNNKSFLYQAVIELNREGLITREEGRATLKKVLNWPIIDPFNPQGQFVSRNMSDEQLAMANGTPFPSSVPQDNAGAPQTEQPVPTGQPVQQAPVEGDIAAQGMPQGMDAMLMEALSAIPENMIPEVLAKLGVVVA
ncbi:MAG: hypothetical protein HF312_17105 [Ignavibacteria bacterium]|jgi:uncharacterized protein Usg|nr:hypothetical protein [Ignavibacteria bacterium]